MAAKGFRSLTTFAASKGFNRMTLYHYLQGKGPFSETYYKLCEILETDPLQLLVPMVSENKVPLVGEISPLVSTLVKRLPDLAVGLFGSRVTGRAKEYSDWDLGVTRGSQGISGREYLSLKDVLEDVSEDLPRSVDLMNLDQAPLWFFRDIDYEPLFLGGNEKSWNFFLGVLRGSHRQREDRVVTS